MRLNENVSIIAEKFTLVPYKEKHVEKYHKWMKNPEMLELTASEPLTLQEEYLLGMSNFCREIFGRIFGTRFSGSNFYVIPLFHMTCKNLGT